MQTYRTKLWLLNRLKWPVNQKTWVRPNDQEYNALMTWYVLSIFLNAYLWIKILKENSIIYVINTIFLIIFYNKSSIKSSRHCILISFYCTLTKDHPLVTIYLNIANYCQLDCCVVSNLRYAQFLHKFSNLIILLVL